MSIEAHLAELERRHRALEAEIAEARAHPSIDDLEIVRLKRRKLLLKDEIVRLRNWRPIYVRSSGPPPTLRESRAATFAAAAKRRRQDHPAQRRTHHREDLAGGRLSRRPAGWNDTLSLRRGRSPARACDAEGRPEAQLLVHWLWCSPKLLGAAFGTRSPDETQLKSFFAFDETRFRLRL